MAAIVITIRHFPHFHLIGLIFYLSTAHRNEIRSQPRPGSAKSSAGPVTQGVLDDAPFGSLIDTHSGLYKGTH